MNHEFIIAAIIFLIANCYCLQIRSSVNGLRKPHSLVYSTTFFEVDGTYSVISNVQETSDAVFQHTQICIEAITLSSWYFQRQLLPAGDYSTIGAISPVSLGIGIMKFDCWRAIAQVCNKVGPYAAMALLELHSTGFKSPVIFYSHLFLKLFPKYMFLTCCKFTRYLPR